MQHNLRNQQIKRDIDNNINISDVCKRYNLSENYVKTILRSMNSNMRKKMKIKTFMIIKDILYTDISFMDLGVKYNVTRQYVCSLATRMSEAGIIFTKRI